VPPAVFEAMFFAIFAALMLERAYAPPLLLAAMPLLFVG